MSSPRFFVETGLAAGSAVTGSIVTLPAAVVHHATRVLRLRDGAAITLFDGSGGEYAATLQLAGDRAAALIHRFEAVERESPFAVTLVQAWMTGDKPEWTVEKAVELGVAAIVLVPAQRSVVVLDEARRAKREQRLRDIAIAACCQCGRNRVPPLRAAATLEEGLQYALQSAGCGVLLAPEANVSLAQSTGATAGATTALALAIGPEGGYDANEQALARRIGYTAVTFGRRILRTETAGIAALAALQALHGDLR